MFTLKRHISLTFILSALALLAMGFSHLALTDIFHGEPDPVAEWTIVQISYLIFLLLTMSNLALAVRIRKINPDVL